MVPATHPLLATMLTVASRKFFLSNPPIFLTLSASDATPNAPEAGTWFQSYFVTLVQNANPAL